MNKKKLVSFGEYLLSKEREEKLKLANTHPYKLKKRLVYDADIDNWKNLK